MGRLKVEQEVTIQGLNYLAGAVWVLAFAVIYLCIAGTILACLEGARRERTATKDDDWIEFHHEDNQESN